MSLPGEVKSSDRFPSTHLTRPLRVLHTADIHLESDTFIPGREPDYVKRALRKAFTNVIDLVMRKEADLLLIAGDLFDSNRVSQEALDFVLQEIERAKVPVVLIPGNHDPHDDESILELMAQRGRPSNLHLVLDFEGCTLDFPRLTTRIWARAMREHTADYRPLQGVAAARPGWWNIALAHGLFVEEEDGYRASPITPAEIAQTGYQYIALGHVHVFQEMAIGATRVVYCGAPVPVHSAAAQGTVAFVSFDPARGVSVEPIYLSADTLV